MKILVTGGAGYIGSILVPMLLREGYKVTVLDSFIYNQTSLLDCLNDPCLKIVKGDVRDEKLVSELIRKFNYVIPLACIVGAPACDNDPIAATSTNLEAIRILLKFRWFDPTCRQKIIFPNTNSGYGVGQEGIYCDENTPLNPVSLYGKLKVQAEKEILESGNAITLRLATVFGASPRMRLDLLVNDFVHQAVTKKSIILFQADFKRNYIHIRDVARAFLHCIQNFESMKNESYNVGLSDANLSKRELCEEIKKQIPDLYFHEAEIGEDPDKRNYIVSNAKMEAAGFKPSYSLQDGITELIKACQIIPQNQFSNI